MIEPPTKEFEYDIKTEMPEEAVQLTCKQCGAVLEPDCIFCVECGAPVGKSAPSEPAAPVPRSNAVRFCTECGYRCTDSSALFCDNCGARLESIEGGAPAQPAAPKEKRCPFCGFRTTDPEVLFCVECGTRLS